MINNEPHFLVEDDVIARNSLINNYNIRKWVIIVASILLIILLFLNSLNIIFGPRWNRTTECLKNIATDNCNNIGLDYISSDSYPKYKYYYKCGILGGEEEIKYEFTDYKIETCEYIASGGK